MIDKYMYLRADYLSDSNCVGTIFVEYRILKKFWCFFKVTRVRTAADGSPTQYMKKPKPQWIVAFPWSGFSNYAYGRIDEETEVTNASTEIH